MTAARRPTWVVSLVFLAVAALAALSILVATQKATRPVASGDALDSARYFLSHYVDADGRVVRRDQGGDTVSEGQGYGMLLAVAANDRPRFDSIWGWTQRHLENKTGLFAWRWQNGHVADPQSATDADTDIARALALAATRFGGSGYRLAAARTAGALLAAETVGVGPGRRVPGAGPWARAPRVIDPSYFSPAGAAVLAQASGDPRLQALAASERVVLEGMARGKQLPPDWATLSTNGDAHPSGAPGGGNAAQYGLDAVRTPVHFAESCDRRDRALAARWWPLLRGGDAGVQPRGLNGQPLPGAAATPAAMVGAAAAAAAAGDRASADALLARADASVRNAPTYYGAAWAALGRVMLTSRALGGCPPLA